MIRVFVSGAPPPTSLPGLYPSRRSLLSGCLFPNGKLIAFGYADRHIRAWFITRCGGLQVGYETCHSRPIAKAWLPGLAEEGHYAFFLVWLGEKSCYTGWWRLFGRAGTVIPLKSMMCNTLPVVYLPSSRPTDVCLRPRSRLPGRVSMNMLLTPKACPGLGMLSYRPMGRR